MSGKVVSEMNFGTFKMVMEKACPKLLELGDEYLELVMNITIGCNKDWVIVHLAKCISEEFGVSSYRASKVINAMWDSGYMTKMNKCTSKINNELFKKSGCYFCWLNEDNEIVKRDESQDYFVCLPF